MLKLPNSVAISLVFLACGSPESPPSLDTVRDSAGISIVESFEPAWGPNEGWIVDPDPILDLSESGTSLAHFFSVVHDAARMPSGEIVVMDSYTQEIRCFSATGDHLWTVGRDGEGPGEFRGLRSLHHYRADSLLAFDRSLQRATVITSQGQVGRVISRLSSIPRVHDIVPLNDGTILVQPVGDVWTVYEGEFGEFYRQPVPIVRVSPEGVVSDTVAFLAGIEWLMTEIGESAQPFQKLPHVAVREGKVYLGDAERFEFQIFTPSGQLQRVVRVPGMDLRISEEDLEKEAEVRLGPNPSPERSKWYSQQRRPETKPAFSKLLVDAEGYVWLLAYRTLNALQSSEQVSNWNVFSPAGEWLGKVRFPARFEVFQIGRDYVLGQRYEDWNISHPQLLRLVRKGLLH